jgi:hypothetical protein
MVFVRAVHAAKYMNDTELAIYDSWWVGNRQAQGWELGGAVHDMRRDVCLPGTCMLKRLQPLVAHACRFDPILNTLPTLIPNGFIYLRASVSTATCSAPVAHHTI